MAQPGNYTPLSLYYSATASTAPLAANLVAGELAINTNDGKLYYKDSAGVVQTIASKAGALGDVVGPASATDNALARFDLTTGKLIQNSVGILSDAGALSGLTGLTSSGSITLSSLTSGRVTYATTGGLLTDSANLKFNGTDLQLSAGNIYWDVPGVRYIANVGDGSSNLNIQSRGNTIFSYGGATVGAGTEAMRITSAGNVGIGTSSPTRKLEVYGGASGTRTDIYASNAAGDFNCGVLTDNNGFISTSNASLFYTNSAERMRITSAGNVGIGISSTTEKLYVNGTAVIDTYLGVGTVSSSTAHINIVTLANTRPGMIIQSANSAANGSFITFQNLSAAVAGSITHVSSTAVLYNTTSDYRLKTVIGAVSEAGTRIDALEPIEYDWNNGGGRTRGFLAHKFAEIYPNSVSGEKDGIDKDGKPKYQAMQASSSEVMADLIAEIQSLRKRVAQLESK
jgi:hypothetical protein